MAYPDYAAELDMGTHKYGDTYLERTFTVTASHGDLTKVEITSGSTVLLSSDVDTEIEITDAATGVWKILEQEITFPPKLYDYCITFTFADGAVRTNVYGTWNIIKYCKDDG